MLGSKQVSDEALLKANDTVRKMFAYRHDILKALIADGARLVVLGRDEKLSDLPEFQESKDDGGLRRGSLPRLHARSLKLMVVPEENVLGLPTDRSRARAWWSSEFARALYRVTGVRPVDPDFDKRRQKQQYELRVKRLDVKFDQKLQKLHDEAKGKGLWNGTAAARDRDEYWVGGRRGLLRRHRRRPRADRRRTARSPPARR